MTDQVLYAGRWVCIAGSHHKGYLVREEQYGQRRGWRVQLTDDWSAFFDIGNIIRWEPFDYEHYTR